ncbi:MAG: sugar phosphate isomerase/epimerase family protein [Candidatus Methanosuratincola sp.]
MTDRLDRSRIDLLIDLGSAWDVRYTVHAPIIDLNIASASEKVRRLSMELVRESVDHARELGALLLVVHPGSFPPDGRGDPETHWRLNLESLSEICGYASRERVVVCLENMPAGSRLFFQTPGEFLRASEEGMDFQVALDLGHAHTRHLTGEFLSLLKGRLRHLHLHDNMGDVDSHLPVDRGTIDWRLVKSEIGSASLTAVVEANTPHEALESLAAARQVFSS